jgi:hypothetical protein
MTRLGKLRLVAGMQIGLVSLAGAAGVWFFALSVTFCFIESMGPLDDALTIRRLWPFRLIQPEWLSRPADRWGDLMMRWQLTETGVRTLIIAILWTIAVALIYNRYHSLSRCRT